MLGSEYDLISRFLHRFALESKLIAELSFDIENMLIKKDNSFCLEKHVFVSGLARSGTTILMRYLHETGLFKSLTYLDMPFVLMPNTWKKISNGKPSKEYKERAHQDGIMVGFDSPEAFEEVFWRVFTGEQYIGKDKLQLYSIEDEILRKFRDYVNNILKGDFASRTRYLSKNNNNVLRFQYLQKCFPYIQIIIPFRDPLQHSLSLLNQHQHFSKVQDDDKFVLNYMDWLGHYEFGLNQKSFFFDDNESFEEMRKYDKSDLNFWLLNWKNYYKYVYANYTSSAIFFNYDRFCQYPSATLSKLFEKIDIKVHHIDLQPFIPKVKIDASFDQTLLHECNLIYSGLENKFNLEFDVYTK